MSNPDQAGTLLSNAHPLEVDFFHAWTILLTKFSSNSNLVASRHIEREKKSASFLGVSSVWKPKNETSASDQWVSRNGPWERIALTWRTLGGVSEKNVSSPFPWYLARNQNRSCSPWIALAPARTCLVRGREKLTLGWRAWLKKAFATLHNEYGSFLNEAG